MIQYEYDIITIDRYKNGKKITKHILYKSKKNFIYITCTYVRIIYFMKYIIDIPCSLLNRWMQNQWEKKSHHKSSCYSLCVNTYICKINKITTKNLQNELRKKYKIK